MSYKDGGTSGDDLENADYYMDVGFEGTVKLEKNWRGRQLAVI